MKKFLSKYFENALNAEKDEENTKEKRSLFQICEELKSLGNFNQATARSWVKEHSKDLKKQFQEKTSGRSLGSNQGRALSEEFIQNEEERLATERFYTLIEQVYVHRLENGDKMDESDPDIFDALDEIKMKAEFDKQMPASAAGPSQEEPAAQQQQAEAP